MKFRPIYQSLSAIAFAALVSACSGSSGGSPTVFSNELSPQDMVDEQYRLNTGDVLLISIISEDAEEATTADEVSERVEDIFTLDATGNITLPMVGTIFARGSSLEELSDVIEDKVDTDVISDPIISIEVATLRPFYIHGAVNAPGTYEYADSLTVGKAIDGAGGSSLSNDNIDARVIRTGGKGSLVVGKLTLDDQVFPGDTISVEPKTKR